VESEGAADDAVLNEIHGKPKLFPFSRLIKEQKKLRKNFMFQEPGWRLLFRLRNPLKRPEKRYKKFL
jgi:hypothetical protein